MNTERVFTTGLLKKFKCQGTECQDTCCGHHWNVDVDQDTLNKILNDAPEFLKLMYYDNGSYRMRAGKNNSYYCAALGEDKLCAIQKKLGEDYLPKTCKKYPRNYAAVGSEVFVNTRLVCPEVNRLMLYEDVDYFYHASTNEYSPDQVVSYVPGEMSPEEYQAIHNMIIDFVQKDKNHSPEEIMMMIINLGEQLSVNPLEQWSGIIEKELNSSFKLEAPEDVQLTEVEQLYYYLRESHPRSNEEELFKKSCEKIENWIFSEKYWDKRFESPYHHLVYQWDQNYDKKLNNFMKSWILGTLSSEIFPFKTTKYNLRESCYVMGVNFAIARMGLMVQLNPDLSLPNSQEFIMAMQSMSLNCSYAKPEIVIPLCEEFGWFSQGGIKSLIMLPWGKIEFQEIRTVYFDQKTASVAEHDLVSNVRAENFDREAFNDQDYEEYLEVGDNEFKIEEYFRSSVSKPLVLDPETNAQWLKYSDTRLKDIFDYIFRFYKNTFRILEINDREYIYASVHCKVAELEEKTDVFFIKDFDYNDGNLVVLTGPNKSLNQIISGMSVQEFESLFGGYQLAIAV